MLLWETLWPSSASWTVKISNNSTVGLSDARSTNGLNCENIFLESRLVGAYLQQFDFFLYNICPLFLMPRSHGQHILVLQSNNVSTLNSHHGKGLEFLYQRSTHNVSLGIRSQQRHLFEVNNTEVSKVSGNFTNTGKSCITRKSFPDVCVSSSIKTTRTQLRALQLVHQDADPPI